MGGRNSLVSESKSNEKENQMGKGEMLTKLHCAFLDHGEGVAHVVR